MLINPSAEKLRKEMQEKECRFGWRILMQESLGVKHDSES